MKVIERDKRIFDQSPYPTWKRISLPDDLFSENLFAEKEDGIQGNIIKNNAHIMISSIHEVIDDSAYNDFFNYEYEVKKSLGDKFTSYINSRCNSGYFIHFNQKDIKPAHLRIDYDFGNSGTTHIENNLIIVEAGSKLDIIFDYSGSNSIHYGTTRVIAKVGSAVRITKLQRLNEESQFYDQSFGLCEEGATIEWYDLEIGAGIKGITYETTLKNRYAKSEIYSIYYGENENQMDISYTMRHMGKRSESVILSKGALDHHAKKVFRGNLEFEKGASQSVGKEQEYVVVLNKQVKSDSIPALMCSEDDVIGEHAASIGRVDQDKLFYLMSRGFTEKEAKKLIVKGSFEEIIRKIPHTEIQEIVGTELDRRI